MKVDDVFCSELDALPDGIFHIPPVPEMFVRVRFNSQTFRNLERVVRGCVVNENDAIDRILRDAPVGVRKNIGAVVRENNADGRFLSARHRFDTIARVACPVRYLGPSS